MADSGPFVTKIDIALAPKMKIALESQGFELTQPEYTCFTAKKKGVSCTLYKSGKLVVQGKDKKDFIEFYLEPEILMDLTYTLKQQGSTTLNLTPRIGIDESGKGDFFGPLCVAGVFADADQVQALEKLGVKDSKTLTEKKIEFFAKEIQRLCPYHIVKINPSRYNELHKHFGNLNTLLAWGHAQTIEHLMKKTGCNTVIIDQFAHESVVLKALRTKKLVVDLTQRHRAEEDVVVAASSILARWIFVKSLKELGEEMGVLLPKGASALTIRAGKELYRKEGLAGLNKAGKLHFKTLDAIVGKRENTIS